MVAGGAYPRFVPNAGDGGPVDAVRRGIPGRIGVLHDAAHRSGIVLPTLA